MLNFIWESLLTWVQGALIASFDLLDQVMLFAFSPQLITMDHYFPGLNDMWDLIVTVAFGMVLALCIFKIFQNSFLTFSKSYENPATIILRSIFAFVVITVLPLLLKYIFEFADTIYWAVLEEGGMTGSAENVGSATVGVATGVLDRVAQSIATGDVNIADGLASIFNPAESMQSLASFLVSLILTVAIVWNYFKLMLEIAERYVVLGIMYYTMPLAAVPIVSRDTSAITKSWLRMLVSELMILGLNVWFVVIFRGAIMGNAMMSGEYEVNGHAVGSGLLWCFLAIAFLKTAQKIDSHIATLGLTTVQLSSGIAGTLLAAGITMRGMAGVKGVKSAHKALKAGSTRGSDGMTPKESAATNKLKGALNDKQKITNPEMVKYVPAKQLAHFMQNNGASITGDAAVAAINKVAPDITKGKNITSAQIDNAGNFTAQYKDANGKDATISFNRQKPEGISKAVSIGEAQGYVKDTGTPYNYDEINNGTTSFNDFAEKHLNGEDNMLSQSGRFSKEDLDGATVSADPSGDGLIIKDKDGFEMAKLTSFDDEHAEGITNDTLIGEGQDGLYRADINLNERYPLPDGYSYAGEMLVDDNGNAISEVSSTGFTSMGDDGRGYENLSGEFINSDGDVVQNAHYQDSYRTADGKYISSDEMQGIMNERIVSPSDYADNLQYSSESGFTNAYGDAVNMDKTGWVQSENDPDIYTNSFTGGMATGEQIAEKYSNPEYASQSYGGFSSDGNEMYFDNYSKEAKSVDDLGDALKYGENPDYSNYSSNGSFSNSASGPRNLGESVEQLIMDKEYSFNGKAGAEIVKAYIPELKDKNVEFAHIHKDGISISESNSNGTVHRENYIREISDKVSSGTYAKVNTSGGSEGWLKTNGSRKENSNFNESKGSTGRGKERSAFRGECSNTKSNASARQSRRGKK